MTLTKGLALLVTVAAAGVLVNASGPAAGAAAATARPPSGSKRSARASTRKARRSSSKQASRWPTIQSRPDPLTLLLDFRNVGA